MISFYLYLNERVVPVSGAKLTSNPLLFAVDIELWLTQDGNRSTLVPQGKCWHTTEPLLVFCWHWQHDGQWLAHFIPKGVEMNTLKKGENDIPDNRNMTEFYHSDYTTYKINNSLLYSAHSPKWDLFIRESGTVQGEHF